MKIIPFVHDGLGNSSYIVGIGEGRAIAIDPDRNIDRYVRAAEQHGWNIETVVETHLHADFVSGAREFVARGATAWVPAQATSRIEHRPLSPGDKIALDGAELEAIASPGHTPEHLGYVLRTGSQPPVLFSGGSLIVGGAGRTDLLSPAATDSATRAQFRTLTFAFSDLPDATLLHPTHGGGSFCSAGNGDERASTLGRERSTNAAMHAGTEDEFANWFPATFPSAPAYFYRLRAFNQAGPRLRDRITPPRVLSVDAFAAEAAQGALVVDARSVDRYSAAHIPGSLHIPFRDVFAIWLGWLVPENTRLLFVADEEAIAAVTDECLLVGYENFAGWLASGVEGWRDSGRAWASASVVDGASARSMIDAGATVIDVRESDEFAAGHNAAAQHIPLGSLSSRTPALSRDDRIVVYCGHGERASTAASILERAGCLRVANVSGGYAALEASAQISPP